ACFAIADAVSQRGVDSERCHALLGYAGLRPESIHAPTIRHQSFRIRTQQHGTSCDFRWLITSGQQQLCLVGSPTDVPILHGWGRSGLQCGARLPEPPDWGSVQRSRALRQVRVFYGDSRSSLLTGLIRGAFHSETRASVTERLNSPACASGREGWSDRLAESWTTSWGHRVFVVIPGWHLFLQSWM